MRIVSDRLRLLTDSVIMVEQGEFMTGRGCVDQVFAVMQVIEKVTEKDKVACAIWRKLMKVSAGTCCGAAKRLFIV